MTGNSKKGSSRERQQCVGGSREGHPRAYQVIRKHSMWAQHGFLGEWKGTKRIDRFGIYPKDGTKLWD